MLVSDHTILIYLVDIAQAIRYCDSSKYALTGAIFADDRYAADELTKAFTNSAGNFCISIINSSGHCG